MTRKAITTSHVPVDCDVCGRTLLRGEHADVFLAGGSRRHVCELCTARAANEGWIREGSAADALAARRRRGGYRGGSLLGRLRQRRDDALEAGTVVPDDPELGVEAPHAYDAGPFAEDAAEPELGRPRPVPTNADLKIERALDLFNASDHPRTVAGIARSLGDPVVSVRTSEASGAVVSIVVAWELSWYRYEVDLGDEAAGVRVAGQGAELDQLPEADRRANAFADDYGQLQAGS